MTAVLEPVAGSLVAPDPAPAAHRRGPLVLAGAAAAGLVAVATAPGTPLLFAGAATVALAVAELARRLRGQLSAAADLDAQRRELLTQGQSTAEELVVATRMMRARAQTMTSVIDAVTEQSIIGTDRDGLIRVWNQIGRAHV